MLNWKNAVDRSLVGSLAVACSLMTANAAADLDCQVHISNTELGFIVTIGGGRGTLTCGGVDHDLRVGGLTVGGMGLAGAKYFGKVKNLKKLEDFPGQYTGGGAGATAVVGGATMTVSNEKGVSMELQASTSGADVKLGARGLNITFE